MILNYELLAIGREQAEHVLLANGGALGPEVRGGRLFSYVLNNYWRTNYRAEQAGPFAFRYSLVSGRAIAQDQACRMGWEARRPLYAQRLSLREFREARAPRPGGGHVGERLARASEVDLFEYELRPLPVEAGHLRVHVPAWGMTTIRLELESEPE